jgi:hypothetical protein
MWYFYFYFLDYSDVVFLLSEHFNEILNQLDFDDLIKIFEVRSIVLCDFVLKVF